MDKREKLEFILYQLKIMIKKKDYVRLIIISKKINPQNLNDKELADIKIIYYSYLIEYYNHESMYLDAAKCYKAILDTLEANPNLNEKMGNKIDFGFDIAFQNILENFILYLIISGFSLEQI